MAAVTASREEQGRHGAAGLQLGTPLAYLPTITPSARSKIYAKAGWPTITTCLQYGNTC